MLAAFALLIAEPNVAAVQQTNTAAPAPAPPEARSSDVASPQAITAALYDVISGEAGKPRDWNRFRSLFHTGAHLTSTGFSQKTGTVVTNVRTPEEYIERNAPFLETHGFFENELAARTQVYGGIAHIFSAYASRNSASDPKPFARGINSIELVNDGKRWWILEVSWASESPAQPLLATLLPAPTQR